MRRLLLVLFSLFFWTTAFTVMGAGALLTFVLLLLGVPYQRAHVWITAPSFALVVRVSGSRLRVHYHPDFDPDRPSVYCQNHVNVMDAHVASWVIPHAFCGMMHAWQFKIPIYGWCMSMSKGIPVERRRPEGIVAQLSAAATERKRIGMSVLTFPEGHRTLDGKLRRFKRGVFLMARNADMPVVPLAVRGMSNVNRKGTWLFHPGHTLDVFVGPQYETGGLSDAEVGELADSIRDTMTEAIERGEWPEDQRLTSEAQSHPT